jgi:hypothetical protein
MRSNNSCPNSINITNITAYEPPNNETNGKANNAADFFRIVAFYIFDCGVGCCCCLLFDTVSLPIKDRLCTY